MAAPISSAVKGENEAVARSQENQNLPSTASLQQGTASASQPILLPAQSSSSQVSKDATITKNAVPLLPATSSALPEHQDEIKTQAAKKRKFDEVSTEGGVIFPRVVRAAKQTGPVVDKSLKGKSLVKKASKDAKVDTGLSQRKSERLQARGVDENLRTKTSSTSGRDANKEELKKQRSKEGTGELKPEDLQMMIEEIDVVRNDMYRFECQVFRLRTMKRRIESAGFCLNPAERVWLVLDTNVLLQDICRLQHLKAELTIKLPNRFMLVIPWVVLQEIDHIKDSSTSRTKMDLRCRARAAVNLINTWLESKDPNVRGQNPKQAASLFEDKDGFVVEKNDDKVLHNCLQLQDKAPKDQVALITLDKHLRNKAMVTEIHAFSLGMLNEWLDKRLVGEQRPTFSDCLLPQHESASKTVTSIAIPQHAHAASSIIPEMEPPAGSSVNESRAPSSVDEPQAPSSVDEPRASSSMDEPRASSSMDEPRASSSMDEPRASSSMDEPRASSSVNEKYARSENICVRETLSSDSVHVEADEAPDSVFKLLDVVLRNLIYLRKTVKEELADISVFAPNRPLIIQSFEDLQRHACAIWVKYKRTNVGGRSDAEYRDFQSVLLSFADKFHLQVIPATSRDLRQFFEDESKRDLRDNGGYQLETIQKKVADCRRLLTPAENYLIYDR